MDSGERISTDKVDKDESKEITAVHPVEGNINNENEVNDNSIDSEEVPEFEELFDRKEVMKFINDSGLLSCNVRSVTINDYFKMAHLLSISNLHRIAIREVQNKITDMIHLYVEKLKDEEKYDDLVLQAKQFKLATQIFDAFGKTVDN